MAFWQFALIYIVIGFMVASITLKVLPSSSLDDAYSNFMLVVGMWPVFIVIGIFWLPFKIIAKWIRFLSGF